MRLAARPFSAEFAHLRAAVAPELPDWREIRFVIRLLEPYASTPTLRDALTDLLAAPDRAALRLAVIRAEAAFARMEQGRGERV